MYQFVLEKEGTSKEIRQKTYQHFNTRNQKGCN